MRRSLAILIAPIALLAAACGSSSSKSSTSTAVATTTTPSTAVSSPVQVAVRTLPGLGPVLVNGQGRTVYVFKPDNAKKVTCVGQCASIWPPLAISAGQKPATAGPVKAALVSSDPSPSGGRVVTYDGWPLYLYVADPMPGTAHGQAINSSGGLWYVISASGTVITKKASTGTGSTSGSGGSGY
jgi:predicted lipoprotein with Yx(FWY)xxD motif